MAATNIEYVSAALKAFAERNNLDYEKIPQQKVIFVDVPVLPAGNQVQIFLPYDQQLKDSIITGIRCGLNTDMFPTNYVGKTGFPIANLGNYIQFVLSLVDKNNKFLLENIPMYFFLQTAIINRDAGVKGMWRFFPENSYLTYFDIGNTKGAVSFPIIFEYHPVTPKK